METLQVNVGQAKETLSLLYDLVHAQRQSLSHGIAVEELEAQLLTWEEIIQRVQQDALLERSMHLSKLYEASLALTHSLDWEETIEAIIDAVIHITNAERGMLVLREEQELKVKVTRNAPGMAFSEADLQFSKSVIEKTLERKEPLLTSNAQLDPRFKNSESIIAYGLRSILCAPLLFQGDALGVIYLENRARTGVFTRDDIAILAAFANQAAVALANAYTFHCTDQALSNRVRELTVLQEMARDLNAGLNFDRVMERSLTWAVTAVEAARGALAVLAEEGLRWVAKLGNIAPDERAARHALYQRRADLTPARIVLPLLREGRPIGVFYLEAGEQPFSEEHIEFGKRIADNAAIAVENARLYEALRNASQAKSEFVSLVSHELRTPMTSIRGYTDMLSKGIIGALNPRQEEFIDAISRNVERMRVLVSDLLDISRIEAGRLRITPKRLRLEQAIREAATLLQEQIKEKDLIMLTDIIEDLPEIYADPDRLMQILLNLLGNAIKYTRRGGTIAFHAHRNPNEPAYIQCSVMDTGVGMTPEDLQRLFTKFFRADDPFVRDQTGTGLGLVITKNLVEMHGGAVWVDSIKDRGTTFHFTLPVAGPENDVQGVGNA